MQVVTLGPAGTYSHRAARAVSDDVAFRESVSAIVAAVDSGEYDRGVVPIENSIEGSVTETLDAIADAELSVTQEIITPIRHALLAQSPNFDTVASHSQALAQCRAYLNRKYPNHELKAVASTADGVERARTDATIAGIGHPDNAGDDLSVVAADIQDRSSNATRFFVVGPTAARSAGGGKSTVVVYPNANYPGLLLELLEAFADRDINLSRIESRPSGNRLGDYLFHIDFEAGLYEDRAKEALSEIESIAADGWVKRLGSYDKRHVVE